MTRKLAAFQTRRVKGVGEHLVAVAVVQSRGETEHRHRVEGGFFDDLVEGFSLLIRQGLLGFVRVGRVQLHENIAVYVSTFGTPFQEKVGFLQVQDCHVVSTSSVVRLESSVFCQVEILINSVSLPAVPDEGCRASVHGRRRVLRLDLQNGTEVVVICARA